MEKKKSATKEKPKKAVQTPVKQPAQSAKAVEKYLRISPRKMRLVINGIRREPAHRALYILKTLNKKAARLVEKGVRSAIANAKVLGMDASRLYVSDIRADEGPRFKRIMTRSMGRADRIVKRTTHLSVVVREAERAVNPLDSLESKGGKSQEPSAKKTKLLKAQGSAA
jgi:large subunit ribosomal protein L22